MSDILRIFIFILLLTVSLTSYFLAAHALFPQRVARTKAIIQSMPGRSFGVGLVNFVFFSLIAIVLISVSDKIGNGFLKGVVLLPALLIIALIMSMLSFGLAAMAEHAGARIVPDALPWKQTLWGSICLCFGSVLPFAGWFLLFPYLGLTGIGAFILGIFQRQPSA